MLTAMAIMTTLSFSGQMLPEIQYSDTYNTNYENSMPYVRAIAQNELYSTDLTSSIDFNLFGMNKNILVDEVFDDKEFLIGRQIKAEFEAEFEILSVAVKKSKKLIFD